MKEKIIVGISGASGMPVVIELLRQLHQQKDLETFLVFTDAAKITMKQETDRDMEELFDLADVICDNQNIGAAIASGSCKTKGMIIVPCSMKTTAGIACGYSDNLLLRAADVVLKERRKLVLGVRECPFSSIHLENMLKLSQMGTVILPLMLSYYQHPDGLKACTAHLVGKILDQFDIEGEDFNRWNGI